MSVSLEITGNLRDRFVQAAALLRLIDPVRGRATTYSLDQDSHMLKRKFLDSFALICATKKNADTVSAACLEEGRPEGTILRIASNTGVSKETLYQLQDIVKLLSDLASGDLNSSDGEAELLLKIVRLDIEKIWRYIQEIQRGQGPFTESIAHLRLRLETLLPHHNLVYIQEFLDWFGYIFSIQDFPTEPALDILVDCIRWAESAKKSYFDFLKSAFSTGDHPIPRWISIVFKLGRYGIATRILVRAASEIPGLFNPMVIAPITAPSKVPFEIGNKEMALTCLLRRAQAVYPEDVVSRLARIWNTDDAEAFFRKSCSVKLVTHAELQMSGFYDQNPHQIPELRFIGVSKKSCYLCSMFLANHPHNFSISSCHQKLYLSWIPPPVEDHQIYNRYKNIILEMSAEMETVARKEIACRLGSRRLPIPADSTAGASLSSLINLRSLKATRNGRDEEVDIALRVKGNAIPEVQETSQSRIASTYTLYDPIRAGEPSLPVTGAQQVHVSEMDRSSSGQLFSRSNCPIAILSMVLHFKYLGDENRQDIVTIGNLLDPDTQFPSWSKLVEFLNTDDRYGLTFRDTNVLVVNGHIRVRNERQFIACLQYLLNSSTWNSDVWIRDCDSAS